MKDLKLAIQNWFHGLLASIKYPKETKERIQKSKTAARKILLDCGANSGRVLEKFIQERQGYEFHAFEPQPELVDTLKGIVAKYPEVNVKYYQNAIWTKDETLEFFLATHWGSGFKDGSTLLQGHTNNSSKVDYNAPVQVQAIDFNDWINNTLKPSKEDYIALKMDIEGAEYDVLEKLIENNQFDNISELMVEFHSHMLENVSAERHQKLLNKLRSFKHLKLILWR